VLDRNYKHYQSAHKKGEDPKKAPLYLRSLVFDGQGGDFNAEMVGMFNAFIGKHKAFSGYKLNAGDHGDDLPSKILIINASHDDLPTSYETAHIFEEYLKDKGMKTQVKVVNDRDGLLAELGDAPEKVMVMSQCVDKNVYNVGLADELEKKGVVIVPGKITAPGSVFSDKDSTYRLLSDEGRNWDVVAKYRKVHVDGKNVEEVVTEIIKAIDELAGETGDDVFFVKPHEGGGGLGGFRITKKGDRYIIPDLSKVSGDVSEIHPTFINVDPEDESKLKELLWIYKLFGTDEKMKANYLMVDLPLQDASEDEGVEILKDYLRQCEQKRESRLLEMSMTRAEVMDRLVGAVSAFEEKFGRRYVALVNEHLDFGFWGLRAHYRLSRSGPVLETMYSRIFQLAFTEQGIGYLGSDNISNKQTGELEILRLGPVNEIMVDSIGGKEVLMKTLLKGANALITLTRLLTEEERKHVPVRVQLDLATLSLRIGEGNADTARGLCLASRWTEFVRNNREWLEDSLSYYAWKKNGA